MLPHLRRTCPLLLLALVTACGTSVDRAGNTDRDPDRGAGSHALAGQSTPHDPLPVPDLTNGTGRHAFDPTADPDHG